VLMEEVLVNNSDILNNFGYHKPQDEVVHVFLKPLILVLTFSTSCARV